MALDVVSQSRCFDGTQFTYRHRRPKQEPRCDLRPSLPRQADQGAVPVVWYLSGLTCTEENFIRRRQVHSGSRRLGLLLVAPDTSRAEMEYRATRRLIRLRPGCRILR